MTQQPSLDFSFVHENKSDTAVILFHGMTGSPFEMKKMAKALFGAGYDVYAECLCGHGTSEMNIKEVRWTDWQNQAIRQVKDLSEKYENIFLSGLCMGATLAISTVIESCSEKIKGVVALSTTIFLDGWTIPKYSILMPMGLYSIIRYYYTFPEREPYGLKNEQIRRKISALQKRNSVALDNYPLSCTYELLKLGKHVVKNISKFDKPILLVHSKYDDLTSEKSAKVVYDNISSSRKEYIQLENSYHIIVLDNERDFVFDKAIDFIKEVSFVKKEGVPV